MDTGSAAFALGSLPLSAVVAFIIVLINAIIINRISKHVSPGIKGVVSFTPRLWRNSFLSFFTSLNITLTWFNC